MSHSANVRSFFTTQKNDFAEKSKIL